MYQKAYLSIEQKIELLRARGMIIANEAKAAEYLQRIGYYRLSAYWHPMRQRDASTRDVLDNFVEGTTFREVTDLYTFDSRLRLVMLDALERLEVSLRTEVALALGKHSPKAHRDLRFLGRNFSKPRQTGGPSKHREWLQRLDKRANESKDQFAAHFRTKYPNDDMPVWVAVELLDFGPLSHLIGGMDNKDLALIGRSYGGIKPHLLKSWAHSLAFTRNVCAHHSRLWNKPLVNQPGLDSTIPQELTHVAGLPDSGKRLCSIASIARYMLQYANPRTKWRDRFATHVETFPASPRLTISSAGFPEDWRDEELRC